MNEWERMTSGRLYNADNKEIIKEYKMSMDELQFSGFLLQKRRKNPKFWKRLFRHLQARTLLFFPRFTANTVKTFTLAKIAL